MHGDARPPNKAFVLIAALAILVAMSMPAQAQVTRSSNLSLANLDTPTLMIVDLDAPSVVIITTSPPLHAWQTVAHATAPAPGHFAPEIAAMRLSAMTNIAEVAALKMPNRANDSARDAANHDVDVRSVAGIEISFGMSQDDGNLFLWEPNNLNNTSPMAAYMLHATPACAEAIEVWSCEMTESGAPLICPASTSIETTEAARGVAHYHAGA